MSLQYFKNEWSFEVKCFCMLSKQESLLQVDSIIFDRFGQACPNYSSKFVISFSHLKNEVRNKVRDLTPLAGSNITLTIYYTSNVLPPLTLFLSQYQIYTNLFLHLINCLCNISLIFVSSYSRSMYASWLVIFLFDFCFVFLRGGGGGGADLVLGFLG